MDNSTHQRIITITTDYLIAKSLHSTFKNSLLFNREKREDVEVSEAAHSLPMSRRKGLVF